MSTSMSDQLHPRPEYLAKLPTLDVWEPAEGNCSENLLELARGLGIEIRQELKLVRPTRKYWLCTKGAESPINTPFGWVVGHVTVEELIPDEHGDCAMHFYSSQDLPQLQGFAYIRALHKEINRLIEEQERSFSHEREQEIEAAQRELEEVGERLASDRRG